jgi:hypothetical protein
MPSIVNISQVYPACFIGYTGVGLLFNESSNYDTVPNNLRYIRKEFLSLSLRPKAIIVFSGYFEAGEIYRPGVIEGEQGLSIYLFC